MKFNYQTKIILSLFSFIVIISCQEKNLEQEVSDKLFLELELLELDTSLIHGEPIFQKDLIIEMYKKGGIFLSQKWSSEKNTRELLEAIREVDQQGLNPEDYHLKGIEVLIEKIANTNPVPVEAVAELELLLTDGFLLLASHLAAGKTDAKSIDSQWNAAKRDLKIDWPVFIDSVLEAKKVSETLQSLTPQHSQYVNLTKALSTYKQFQAKGGWESFNPSEKKLEQGMIHPDVAALRNRLSKSQGNIEADTENINFFDSTLHQQLVIFQKRNGLPNDGVLGQKTIDALNVSVDDRIASIEANLERWRWIEDSLGTKHILVNIADFKMQLIENKQVTFETEAIVGKPYRKTPVFSSSMTFMVLNPDWTVPPTILSNDVIPAVRKNQKYLSQKNMKVLTRDGKEVDPSTVDWQKAASGSFPYMIRQSPGKDNALGKVKFMFPNQYNVYIHDTPSRELFSQTERIFSSGCIRINRPIEFAKILVEEHKSVNASDIDKMLQQTIPKTVRFENPIPVHLVYLTTWADDEGTVYFRRDIYDRDLALLTALKKSYNSSKGVN
ncbi:MAG: L,D-transpeptidase family protein [Flavobacteriales bacterium]|nr:L,D-transpeptidase family protein [Flavobacteriales bacterium]MCW8940903.1 L,D-transpeptidase family protein [Flavobacteriales bacterium]